MPDAEKRPSKLTRRRLLKVAGLSVGAVALGGVIDGLFIEPWWVDLPRPVVSLPMLPEPWDAVTIAHVTDIHAGRVVKLDYIEKVVRMTLEASADVVVFTGDLVTRTDAITAALGRAIARLRAPLGQFAVLGNHDYWTDADAVTSLLEDAGFVMLTSRHVLLERAGRKLCLAGVDDLWEGEQHLDAALAGVDEDVPRVLLCHNPDYAEVMPAGPRVDLMLCGHTHGGQVKIPFGPRPRLPITHKKYAAGLNRGPHCPVYTSRGVGMLAPAVRFNCRPEIPVITLKRAHA